MDPKTFTQAAKSDQKAKRFRQKIDAMASADGRSQRSNDGDEEVEVSVTYKMETEKAYLLVSDRDKEFWVPKSKVVLDLPESMQTTKIRALTLRMPKWLALEKGLI